MIMEYEGYYIKPHKVYPNNYVVVTTGQGGKIPAVLDTMFTTRSIAKTAIEKYLAVKPEPTKGRTNASKTGSEG